MYLSPLHDFSRPDLGYETKRFIVFLAGAAIAFCPVRQKAQLEFAPDGRAGSTRFLLNAQRTPPLPRKREVSSEVDRHLGRRKILSLRIVLILPSRTSRLQFDVSISITLRRFVFLAAL